MSTLLFIDYSFQGFSRYAAQLVSQLHLQNKEVKCIGLFMSPEKAEKTNGGPFDDVTCANDFSYDPETIYDYFKPDAIIVFAHRFFDYMFTLAAHNRGICVFNFQHGIYMDSTVISTLSFHSIRMLIKKKRAQINLYLKCIYYMNQRKMAGTLNTLFRLIKYHKMYYVINSQFGKQCNADYSFVFGTYWEHYYKEQYKESFSKYEIIGYPELETETQSVDGLFKNDLPTVCYLAQTSVEDGLVPEHVIKDFLELLKESLTTFNLVLKLHPRSNIKLYDDIIHNKNVCVWAFNNFPKAEYFIGHESSVIARALYQTNRTLIYRLAPDRISPFEKYSDFVCTQKTQFHSIFHSFLNAKQLPSPRSDFSSYVYNNPHGSIRYTASFIAKTIS